MTSEEILIDGSQGEGGGQIVRSSLALSLVTGRPIQIDNVRAGRAKPGLMRQHLTSVRAAGEVGNAEVDGDTIGSTAISFRPRGVRAGDYTFSVGTAGSATLVLQTVLPALLIADGPSNLTLEGGTHNPWAPPFDFLAKSFAPLVARMGPRLTLDLQRYGFYPAGGGRFVAAITPSDRLQGFDLLERADACSYAATAIVSNLPGIIARREIDAIAKKTGWSDECFQLIEVPDAHGPGNLVMVQVTSGEHVELFSSFGEVGVKAENVAKKALGQMRSFLKTDAVVGPYLADQWLLPLAIAAWQSGQTFRFRTMPLSRHSTTHIDLLRRFLEIPIETVRENASGTVLVEVGPGV